MRRNITLIFVILFSFILQTTVFASLSLGNVCPNLLIIVTATYGFMFGRKYGMTVGFICGLLMDVFYGSTLGFYALVYLYIGFGNGFFHRIFYQEDIKLPLALISASDLIYSLVTYILLFLLRGRFDIFSYAKDLIIPETIYTIFVSVFLYPLILLVNRTKDPSEKRGERKFAKKD